MSTTGRLLRTAAILIIMATLAGCTAFSGNGAAFKQRGDVTAAVDALSAAYESHDINGFMVLVSDRFTLDKSVFETAVRKDFTAFTAVSVDCIVDSVVPGEDGMVYVTVTFNISRTDVKTGNTVPSSGSTALVFRLEDGAYRLYSMQKPYIFGISG